MLMRLGFLKGCLCGLILLAATSWANAQGVDYSWQRTHAKVLEHGDLEWAAEPFVFRGGDTVRYIDYENGDDNHAGSKASPWKHHPWDKQARGNAARHGGPTTYVFKRGVIYRGALKADESGRPEDPIRLTSDPEWGDGEAMFYGSKRLTDGWKQAAHPKMPDGDKVWAIELDFPVRTLWLTEGEKVTRIALARDPNWEESDPNDLMSEWYVWENPRWWTGAHQTRVGRHSQHLGIDTKVLTGDKDDYVGGTVWTEWGIVMGSPYPSKISAYDARQKAVAFRGPWTWDASEKIIRGNRYFLEDRPQWLDSPGEFWFDRKGRGGGTLYVRLPGDRNPNEAVVEAGRELDLISASQLEHVEVSGLTFRFTNVGWEYNDPQWSKPYLKAGVFHLSGSGDAISIHHNRFEHVHMPVRIGVDTPDHSIGSVSITDNVMRFTDHGAIEVRSHFEKGSPAHGLVEDVEILRNQLYHIGWRNLSGAHGHAIQVSFPTTCEIAGNFLYRIAGWGIANMGGKPSKNPSSIPFTRHMIHHNRVEDPLLKSNDWGGIETWQGGPHYVYNNLSINPGGFKNWGWKPEKKEGTPRFGFAYYLDGSFKNYLFNNIAWGKNNEPGSKLANTSAIQNIISFENTFANNTLYKFVIAARQQKPDAGRFRYLGNVIYDISELVFRHADKPKNPDPNAAHYSQGNNFAYDTIAYARNVFFKIGGSFGLFEETGASYDALTPYSEALEKAQALASSLGVIADKAPLRDPENGDFRPVSGSAVVDRGVKPWVPWSLYAVVGEWNFLESNRKPEEVMDEHWYMTSAYGDRSDYMHTPRYPLKGVNIGAEDYTSGDLEDWIDGALILNGQDQYLELRLDKEAAPAQPEQTPEPVEPAKKSEKAETKETDVGWAVVTHPVRAAVGEPMEVIIRSKEPLNGEKLRADLHWLKEQGWGGANVGGNAGEPTGEADTVKFTFVPVQKEGLYQFLILAYRSPGGWAEKTKHANVNVLLAREESSADEKKPDRNEINVAIGSGNLSSPKTPTVDMETNSFIVEAYFRTEHAGSVGTLVSKAGDGTGYVVTLDADGFPQMALSSGGNSALVKSDRKVNDGQWHHLLFEIDRIAGKGTVYVDGQSAGSTKLSELPSDLSLSNDAAFLVGKGNNGAFLSVTLDFLRVSRGTLRDARTSIAELYAWQFHGPFLRDFTGAEPNGDRRDAGAIELKN